jgi:putative hemolysin
MKTPVSSPEGRDLIDLDAAVKGPFLGLFWRLVAPLLSQGLRFDEINRVYRETLRLNATGSGNYFDHILTALGVEFEVSQEDLGRIPVEGPLATVSNHPFGGLDGIVLGAVLSRRRPDFKLLVNYLLAEIEPMRPNIISVDPFGGKNAAKTNLGPMRECLKWLKQGGALGLFPSGTVSHLHPRRRQVTDPLWVTNLAGIIRRGRAAVVPIYFEGRNSNFFQAAGLLHPRFRTALLPREMCGARGRVVKLRIGHAISPNQLDRFKDDESMMGFLRLKTYILRNRQVAEKTSFRKNWRRIFNSQTAREEIIPALDPTQLAAEVAALDADQCLVEHGDYRVYYARARQIPVLLQEIGRLREVTFRAVGEGTGTPCDLDRFDETYIHLFMWNEMKREIVGAYRLGPTDEILRRQGPQGLYTTTLFRFKPGVLQRLSPALEMGRSFITAEYQRKHLSLGLIWRGIGQFVAKFPRYRTLFGPVSISQDYQSLSKNLIVMYLRENTLDPDFSGQVRAKKPPRSRYFGRLDQRSFSTSVRDIEDVSALISEIEREEKGVPVLLKQYLKLNATMLSFNVDPEFNDCIDGLVLVDLVRTNEKTLRRYMGDEGIERFYAYHETRKTERLEAASLDD